MLRNSYRRSGMRKNSDEFELASQRNSCAFRYLDALRVLRDASPFVPQDVVQLVDDLGIGHISTSHAEGSVNWEFFPELCGIIASITAKSRPI